MRLVLCATPQALAEELAHQLVEARLCACVSIIPQVISIYRWQGQVEQQAESMLLIKTTDEKLAELQAQLVNLHPYEVPEVLALQVADLDVHPPYLRWLVEQVGGTGS